MGKIKQQNGMILRHCTIMKQIKLWNYWILESCKCPKHMCSYLLWELNRGVIHIPDDENLQKLNKMRNISKEIANKSGKSVRCLTEDTGNCLSHHI